LEANAEAECIVTTAVEAAEKEKEERLVRASQGSTNRSELTRLAVRRVVEKVVRCICKP